VLSVHDQTVGGLCPVASTALVIFQLGSLPRVLNVGLPEGVLLDPLRRGLRQPHAVVVTIDVEATRAEQGE
jgi:hypothetical protein